MLKLVELHEDGPELNIFREMLREYQSYLDFDLCFQHFEKELENPFSKYGPPRGIVLLGYWDGDVCACGAMQDLGENSCELKRIFVRPAFRRRGIAKSISVHLMERAKEIGYKTAKLDTLRRLAGAVPLYESLGFIETSSYNYNPESDVVYMERSLVL